MLPKTPQTVQTSKYNLFQIFPANPCLIACCLHDHKSRAVKRKREMPLKWEKGFARSSFTHSGHPYSLLIFQLTALATAILKFLTSFSPKGFSKQPWMFHCLGPELQPSSTQLCYTLWPAERIYVWTVKPCRLFPLTICSYLTHSPCYSHQGKQCLILLLCFLRSFT